MSLKEAHRIINIWGAYLEYCHDRLKALFISSIPESLLPYKLEVIEEAINITAKNYYDEGDFDKYELLHKSFGCLALYSNDDKAIEGAVFKFKIPEVKQQIISNMKKIQASWVNSQDERI